MALPLELIPALARAADIATRNDAASGLWVGERDYVAGFLATLRNAWRLLGGEAELRMGNLGTIAESLLGCDFLLVLQSDDCFKYGLFEAKWVRRPTAKGSSWDYGSPPSIAAKQHFYPPPLVVPKKVSHFSDQLARQQNWLTLLAKAGMPKPFVAEMFLQLAKPGGGGAPYDNPALFDQRGSTFLWHREARERIAPPLLGAPQYTPVKHWSSGGGTVIANALMFGLPKTVDALLEEVLACREGDPVFGRWEQRPPPPALLKQRHSVLLLRGEAPPSWRAQRRG